MLLRREAFAAAGGFDSSLMWLRASREGSVVKLDWPFVRYTDVASGNGKGLERVYRTSHKVLERELGVPPTGSEQAVMAWHHLRFAAADPLEGDRTTARACLADLREAGLIGASPEASVRYLPPFLAGRVKGRRNVRRGGWRQGLGVVVSEREPTGN